MRLGVFVGAILMVLIALAGVVPPMVPAHAGAVSTPAVLTKQFSGTATDTAQLVQIQSTSGQKVGATVSVLVCNDDAAGGEDLWINFNGTAADPGTAFAESSTFAVKPGERINVDGQFLRASVRDATGGQTLPCRIIASY